MRIIIPQEYQISISLSSTFTNQRINKTCGFEIKAINESVSIVDFAKNNLIPRILFTSDSKTNKDVTEQQSS